MNLIKVKDGLLETENFFLVSSFADFAGSSNVSRDISTGKLKLVSNNKIERSFNYNEFVIEVDKQNFKAIGEDEYMSFYLSSASYAFGIKEANVSTQHEFLKLIKQDNYIQAYTSDDGVNYQNIGGMQLDESIVKQGFAKNSNEDFILNEYKVYSCPYITIQNFPEGTTCELYDSKNTLLRTRSFDDNLECKVFIDGNMQGYFIFKDSSQNVIYKSDTLSLNYGDTYVFSSYDLEIIYNGTAVNNQGALLDDLEETITIKNTSNTAYADLKLAIETSSNDLIQISLDGTNYADSATISNLEASGQTTIYLKITRNADNHNFAVRDFQLVIG